MVHAIGPFWGKFSEVHMNFFKKFAADKRGATAIEYGLIAALIAVAAIGALTSVGTKLSSTFSNASEKL